MGVEKTLVDTLRERRETIATCESLTAGLVAARIANVPGASDVLQGGMVTYTAEMKEHLAGVDARVVELWGVVSQECARAMARGVQRRTHADWAVSLTGVAGPEACDGHPVGEVHIAVVHHECVWVRTLRLPVRSERAEVRKRSVDEALSFVLHCMGDIDEGGVS